jgi:ubiquinone/menaquinone biosynthesis C-methylase UbiE
MKKYTEIEKQTKEIYIEQHKAYLKDKELFDRFYQDAVDPARYLQNKEFFKGINVLDAGCGNTAYFEKAMYDLGAKSVTCLDIGAEWQPVLKSALNSLGIKEGFASMVAGSVTEIPLESESFDLVCSNGVIMHLNGLEEAGKAVTEMARVTKKGGKLYLYVGVSRPGIVDRYIVPSLRKAYLEDKEFKYLIDSIRPEEIQSDLEDVLDSAVDNDATISKSHVHEIIKLITLDTTTFLQNMLQVPIQQGPLLGFDWVRNILDQQGFGQIQRIPNKYWIRKDVRKFLAPFHFNSENRLSKIFYGDGHLKIIATKLK